ncbi:hypothetical protein [Amycolatopsis eburnea]|uniref:DUF2637 domain-containing protein n=1 Tax=Amycolatopsis eburnea TaxID=2267691 RepID=A0A3R9EBB1_9PSEU|nr:hypothetical protein [Amycolatopsis eburnea]RSD26447.1 hypothetical protein EIY87_00230 [Amycolatopsis eburnea]
MSTYREEKRADRRLEVQLAAEAQLATTQARIAERRAVGEQRRLDQAAAREQDRKDRDERRETWAKRWKTLQTWSATHFIHLLFVPVIGVPAMLSWTAMAAYGSEVFGPIGWGLPAFSEAAAWVFAAANTITRHRHPGAPTWHLQTGTWLFAAVAAVLNFVHGAAGTAHEAGRLDFGVVMALVSVAGVIAHQLITAGPRGTREERADARIRRQAAKREFAVRRAATRVAVAELDEHGQARLVYRPGTVTLQRRFVRRAQLVDAVVPAAPIPVPDLADTLDDEITELLDSTVATEIRNSLGTAETVSDDVVELAGSGARDPRFPELLATAREAINDGRLPKRPTRRQVRELLGCRTQVAGAVRKVLIDHDDDGPTTAAVA